MDDGAMPMRPGGPIPTRVGIGGYDEERGIPVFEGLATRQGYKQETNRLEKIRFSHEAMIDMILANPRIKNYELAEEFGYSPMWVSRVLGSDAFQAALAKRKTEIVDPFLVATMEERLKGLAIQSVEIIADKLEATKSADLALKTLDLSVKAMGFGARDRSPAVQNNYVVQLPGKANSVDDWAAAAHSGAYNVLETVKTPPKILDNFSTTVTHDPTVQPTPMKSAGDE
jgi:hypothetical protein